MTSSLRSRLFIFLTAWTVLRPQPAATAIATRPLSIGVVIETHPHQADVIEFERQVVASLRSVLAGPDWRAFIISYSDHTRLVSDWTPVSGLTEAAAGITLDVGVARGRGAVLNDGLMDGLNKLGASAEGQSRGLIVIGEGNDDGSTARFGQVVKAARDKRIQCFALLVANHRSQVGRVRQFGFDLYRLASATEGQAYDVRTNLKAMSQALEDMRLRLTADREMPSRPE